MLIEKTLFGETVDKVQTAIARLKQFEPPEGYYLAFSGGKDSIVIKQLANMAKVQYDAHYNNTTIDPPELIYFIKEHYPDVKIENPKHSLLKELVRQGFPTRLARWCCKTYKEKGGTGRITVTGIRWEESSRRKRSRMVELCFTDKTKTFLNVIIDWTEQDVWEFIKKHKMPYCKLYDQGWKRIGCLMCPFTPTRQRKMQAKQYPKYTEAFIRAFTRLHEERSKKGLRSVKMWKDGEEMFWWWLYNSPRRNPDQTVMFE